MATATVDLQDFTTFGPINGAAFVSGIDDRSYKYQFWRKPDGWVTIGGGWPVEYARLIRKGFQSLEQYGQFHVTPDNYQAILTEAVRTLPGFASELPVEQILQYGWHRQPPAGVSFPQLDGIAHEDVLCTVCKRPFLSTEDLARHESISHKEASANNSLARALADALGKGGENGVVEAITLLAESQQQQGQILGALAQTMQQMQALLGDQAAPKAGK